MSDRHQADNRIEVGNIWAAPPFDHTAIMRQAQQIRASETARMAAAAGRWLRARFGKAPDATADGPIAGHPSEGSAVHEEPGRKAA